MKGERREEYSRVLPGFEERWPGLEFVFDRIFDCDDACELNLEP